jgi:hypothetical protein
MTVGTNNPYYDEPSALRKWKKGPLSPYLDGFAWRLYECGYSPGVGQGYVRCISFLKHPTNPIFCTNIAVFST